MKALSGVDRVWSGARAPQRPTGPPSPPSRHLAPGGRIGMVMPVSANARTESPQPSDEADGRGREGRKREGRGREDRPGSGTP
ncbi:hypothetical protein [Streptomyces sp. NPDC003832]